MKEQSQKEFEERKKKIIVSIVVFLVITSVIIASFVVFGNGNSNTDFRRRYRDYNDGWTLIVNGERSQVDLPVYVELKEGDQVVLKKNLPASILKYSALATRNYHMKMDVMIDNERVYSYPQHWDERVSIISDAWSVINLKPEQYRKTIEIRFTDVGFPHFSGYLEAIYFGDDNSIIQHIRESGFFGFITGVIVMIVGGVIVLISWVYRKFSNQQPNTPMGLALFFFGAWMANRSKMPFFAESNGRVFFLALIALLLAGPCIFLYSYYRNNEGKLVSLWGFRIGMGFALLFLSTTFIIKYNVQWIAGVAYFICLVAILNQCYLLYRSSFGPESGLRGRTELTLDRMEFFATAIFPVAGAVEMVVSSDQLWTELSIGYRIVILFFVAMYILTIAWKTYLVMKDRTLVTDRLQESQLELMMGQIQPHFIFNTLSSIRTLIKVDPDIAYGMLYDFSNYLRANVDNVTNLEGIKFAAEVEHIKSYVNIEKVRFGNRLNVEYNIEVSDFIVPPLSIQPLVENAIKHGVCQRVDGGTVWLSSYEDEDHYIVEIDDDGVGFSKEAASAIFSIYADNEDKVGMESNDMAILAMKKVMETVKLYDENGEKIELGGLKKKTDLSGHGSKEHKSTGMLNIILRLRTISNAEMSIESMEGDGTKIKVMFPKA